MGSRAFLATNKTLKKEVVRIEKLVLKQPIEKYYIELKTLSKQWPDDIFVQTWFAAIMGDYSQTLPPKKEQELKKQTVRILSKQIKRLKGQAPKLMMLVRNEYYYHSQLFKKQYLYGKSISHKEKRGYFSQGVGASEYAYTLFVEGEYPLSKLYANKSINAWNNLRPPLKAGNCFYIQALALSGNLTKARMGLNQLVKDDPHYKDHRRWYKKYQARLNSI